MKYTRMGNLPYYLGQLVLIVIFAFPLLWVLSLSLKSPAETLESPPGLLPDEFLWTNYTDVLETSPSYCQDLWIGVSRDLLITS